VSRHNILRDHFEEKWFPGFPILSGNGFSIALGCWLVLNCRPRQKLDNLAKPSAFTGNGANCGEKFSHSGNIFQVLIHRKANVVFSAPPHKQVSGHKTKGCMDTSTPQEFTQLLLAWHQGDQAALDQIIPLVHEELKRLAHYYMRSEHAGHTLQTTALVNEAYLRLVDSAGMQWQSRAHFLSVAAQLMRRVLVDEARKRNSHKRGNGAQQVSLEEGLLVEEERMTQVLVIDEALEHLAQQFPRQGRVVEMRFFAGLEGKEIAEVLKISPALVTSDWHFARAWLQRHLSDGKDGCDGH
jgi:RNA polymerase sigma-70 factor, ECF subfamily